MPRVTFRRSALSAAVAAIAVSATTQAHAQAAATPAAAASDAGDGQVVVVRASADASAGGLKAPYAGGQVARGGRVGLLGSQDVMDTPFSITDYTQKLIQDQQAASIADVLQNDPAVRVTRGFGNFQQAYFVRGLVIYSDDISYNGLYGLLPRQYLASELVERVEVLRGASAFLNGAAPGGSGLGGAINISPKRAPNAPLTEATAGYDDGQPSEAVDVARRFGPDKALGLRANVVHREGSSDAVAGEKGRLDAALLGVDFHAGGMRVSADFGSQNHQLTAVTPSITIASGPIPIAPDAARQIAQPWTYSNERDTFGTLRAEVDLASNVTAWAAGGFRDGHEANNLTSVTIAPDDSSGIVGSATARHDSIRTGEVGLRGTFSSGPVKHTIVGSYGAYQDVTKTAFGFADFTHPVAAGTLYDTAFVPLPDETFYTGGSRLDDPRTTLRIVTSSEALADTMGLLGDRVLLTVGGRRQQIEDTSFDAGTGAVTSVPDKAARITPVAGIVLKASQQVSLYATYIEGLVAGDIAPATWTSGGQTLPTTNGGEAFKPYQTKQGEIGVKVDTGHYGGTVSVFEARKPSYAVVDGTFGQSATQRDRGAELSVYGEALPGVRVLGGASFLQTDLAGMQAIGAPRQQYNLGFDVDVPSMAGLALDVRAVRTSTQYADTANTQVVPSWSRFDIGGRYAFDVAAHDITLRAGINNIANRNYWASSGGYPGAGYLTLGTPRTFVVAGTFDY